MPHIHRAFIEMLAKNGMRESIGIETPAFWLHMISMSKEELDRRL